MDVPPIPRICAGGAGQPASLQRLNARRPSMLDAIALASQTGLKVIIDDSKARRVAENMGLKVTGTIGVLMKAERIGLIESAHDKVRELREKGFYVFDELMDDIAKFEKSS